MIELTLTYERKTINTFKFDKDKEMILIGRDPTCDVRIDNVGISRHHSRIEQKNDVYVLVDLGSGNGTFVRGKRVDRYNLNNGDEINIWNYSLFFKIVQPGVKKDELSATSVKKQDLDLTIAIDARQLELKQRERAGGAAAYLVYTEPKLGERTYSLMKTTTFFGKSPKCEFKLSGWFVQPRHTMIVRDESGFRFVNCAGSKLGVVNGMAVDDYRLQHGDVIKIGDRSFKFFVGLPGR